jgi:hypothetical protein
MVLVAWDLNNYMQNRLQDIAGRCCLKNKLIITINEDMNEEFPG